MATTVVKTEKRRDLSIELCKFVAVLLVINSHLKDLYVSVNQLSTGGVLEIACFSLFLASRYSLVRI